MKRIALAVALLSSCGKRAKTLLVALWRVLKLVC